MSFRVRPIGISRRWHRHVYRTIIHHQWFCCTWMIASASTMTLPLVGVARKSNDKTKRVCMKACTLGRCRRVRFLCAVSEAKRAAGRCKIRRAAAAAAAAVLMAVATMTMMASLYSLLHQKHITPTTLDSSHIITRRRGSAVSHCPHIPDWLWV